MDAMIYGANGFTGRLVVERCVESGLRPVLAARNGAAAADLAARHGLASRAFALDDPDAVLRGLAGVSVLLNAAGPFSATAEPLVDACMATGAHYCDVTGEVEVFERLAARDAEASEAGVMLLPGIGFDVVPSDCLLSHVASRVPGAERLRISIGGTAAVSRGTAKTILGMAHLGTAVRRGGRLEWLARAPVSTADFGDGPVPTVGVSYGDVSTAWASTGVPDIEAFMHLAGGLARVAALGGPFRRLLGGAAVRTLLGGLIDRALPAGPDAERRSGARMVLLAEVWDASGGSAASRLSTPEPYGLTAALCARILPRMARGEASAGFQTASTLFGPDFILDFEGVERVDL